MASVPSGSPDELPIDVELIKVLASDSRRDILRLLGERRRTLTELADALGLKKATVLEHLGKLVEADLIKRLDQDERLWVYYELTPRGKRLVRPERTRFFLILGGTAAAALILGAIVAAAMFSNWGGAPDAEGPSAPQAGSEMLDDADGGVDAPPIIWRGLDESAAVRVSGAPDGSTLRVRAQSGGAVVSAPIAEGLAVLDAEDIDGLAPGTYALSILSDVGERELFDTLIIQEPNVAVFPLAVPQNASASIEVSLGPRSATPPAQADVRVDGEPRAASGAPLRVDLLARNESARLEVGRLYSQDIVVVPQFTLETAASEGNVTLRASEAGSGPLANARITLDGVVLGVTNESGALVAPAPAPGGHALRITAQDGRSHERAIQATSDGNISELPPALRIDALDARVPSSDGMRIRADVFNDGPAEQLVTVAAREQGELLASQLVRVPANGRAQVLLESALAHPYVVDVTAHAARASLTVRYATLVNASGDTAYESAPPPMAPMTAATSPAAGRVALTDAADARDTVTLAQPTMTSAAPGAYPTATTAPRVPLASPVLLAALVAFAAIALRARRAR